VVQIREAVRAKVREKEKKLEVLRQRKAGEMAQSVQALKNGTRALKGKGKQITYLKLQREFLRLEGVSRKDLPTLSVKGKDRTVDQLLELLKPLFQRRETSGGDSKDEEEPEPESLALRGGEINADFHKLVEEQNDWVANLRVELVKEVSGELAAKHEISKQKVGKKRKLAKADKKANSIRAKSKRAKCTKRKAPVARRKQTKRRGKEERKSDQESDEESGGGMESASEDDAEAPWAGNVRPWTAEEAASWEWGRGSSGKVREIVSEKDGGKWEVYCCEDDDTLAMIAEKFQIELDDLFQMAELNPAFVWFQGLEHKKLNPMTDVVVAFKSGIPD
jgi:hypothetical protein